MSEEEEDYGTAYVSASLGALNVEVHATNVEEAHRVFEEVWQERLEETSEMNDATRKLRRGYE